MAAPPPPLTDTIPTDYEDLADIVFDYRVKWRTMPVSGTPPERRCWHASAATDRYLYISGGYSGYTYFGDIHVLDLQKQTWVASAPEIVKPRYAHSLSACGGSLYAFGGARERLYFKNFNALPTEPGVYRAGQGSILAVDPLAQPTAGGGADDMMLPPPLASSRSGSGPTERAAHCACVCDGLLYLFGGDAGKGVYFNDLHIYDPKARVWQVAKVKGSVPCPRGWCTLNSVGRKLFLLFGTNGNDVYSYVFVFDVDTLEWSKMETKGADPLGRHSHSACVRGDSIFVFGGVGERKRQLLSDIHILHTSTCRWITATHAPGMKQLEARYGHTASFYGREMLVFGGCLLDPNGTRSYSNDVLGFSFETRPYLRGMASTLVEDLGILVDNKEFFSDITFMVENRPVHAHKCILAARNKDFFQKLLLGPHKEKNEQVITIPDISHTVFLALLEYIYTGKVVALAKNDEDLCSPSIVPSQDPSSSTLPPSSSTSSEETSLMMTMASSSDGGNTPRKRELRAVTTSTVQLAADLLQAAHMYNMRPLERQCCQKLISSISVENCSSIWELSVVYSLKALRVVCAHFARSNIEPETLQTLLQDISPELRETFQQDLTSSPQ